VSCSFASSNIRGNAVGLKDMLRGRSLLVDLDRVGPEIGDAMVSSTITSIRFRSASEDGLKGTVVAVLYVEDCDVNKASEGGRANDSELSDVSDIVRDENEMLGGREDDCCEAADDRLLDEGLSIAGAICCFALELGSGRKNDTLVRALLSTGFSSNSSGVGAFTSGSLYSSFPYLSDAKYSSPRPKTTCSDAKSRSVPSVGYNHCLSAGWRS